MSRDSLSNRCEAWAKDLRKIERSVEELCIDDMVFWGFNKAVESGHDFVPRENLFYRRYGDWYFTHSVIKLRAIFDHNRDTCGLMALLPKMAERANQFSQEWYLDQYPQSLREFGSATDDWASIAAPNATHFKREWFEEDITAINSEAKLIKSIADQHIAHLQRKPRSYDKTTWRQLSNAIQCSHRITRRYLMLIEQRDFPPVSDEIIEEDMQFWEAAFTSLSAVSPR